MPTLDVLTTLQPLPAHEQSTSVLLLVVMIVILIIISRMLTSEIGTLTAVTAAAVASIFANLRALIIVLLAVLLVIALAYTGSDQAVASTPPGTPSIQSSIPNVTPADVRTPGSGVGAARGGMTVRARSIR